MDGDGTWLDVGCANGHLLATLPGWCAERGISIQPYGLELLPAPAERARSLQPLFDDLSDAGYPPDGRIRIDRPRRHPLLSAWIDG